MADKIRIKRRVSGAPGAPSSLENAELAYNEVDHTLYYGEGTGGAGGTASVIVAIGGTGMAYTSTPAMNGTAAAGSATQWSRGDHVHPSDTSRAPLASPVFTGDPQAPTPTAGDNDTSIATTAFVRAVRLDQFALPTASVNINNQLLTNVAAPSAATDAANKGYVDSAISGLDPKASVRAATTANLASLSAPQTVDGVSLIANDRVLVKDQTTQANNGIYIVNAGAWTRTTDADTWNELISAFTFVEEGTVNADTGWVCTANAGGTIGSTANTWTQFSSAAALSAGTGMTKTGSVLDVIGTAGRIVANADNIDIDSAYVGQTSITTLGTIATGTWSATTIAVARGGTGATTLTGYVKGNGTSAFTASATIPNTDITGLGTMSTQNANAVAITGGTITGLTASMAFTTTGIGVVFGGGGSIYDTSTSTTIAANADNFIVANEAGSTPFITANATGTFTYQGNYVYRAGGTDVPIADGGTGASDATTARSNLGLGTMATQNANAVAITGGTIDGVTIDGGTF